MTKRFTTFGIASQATYRARNIRPEGLVTRFVAWRRADELGEVVLPMPGAHNVLNALGVLAVADFLAIPFETYVKALSSFEGVARRFTVRGGRAPRRASAAGASSPRSSRTASVARAISGRSFPRRSTMPTRSSSAT